MYTQTIHEMVFQLDVLRTLELSEAKLAAVEKCAKNASESFEIFKANWDCRMELLRSRTAALAGPLQPTGELLSAHKCHRQSREPSADDVGKKTQTHFSRKNMGWNGG